MKSKTAEPDEMRMPAEKFEPHDATRPQCASPAVGAKEKTEKKAKSAKAKA